MHQITSEPVWRISFSLSEKLLVDDFTMAQRKCFLLLKIILKALAVDINTELEEELGDENFIPFKVSGFLLKHTMFWTMEEVNLDEWRMNNLHGCILHVLGKLQIFLKDKCIPHYFFGKRKNLLHGDLIENTKEEMSVLDGKCKMMLDGIGRLKNNKYLLERIISCTNNEHLVGLPMELENITF
eukprot:TRINITY_DN29623_c0_g1_i1.p1 TRINITY_DN29623_c0_g1~~TRINITY_DN29623_c0_g1_i1.p1  ORF type:complete len:184 (+),score=40.40 TRINITY_DN29623_c0_g1_i1:68-619(+)